MIEDMHIKDRMRSPFIVLIKKIIAFNFSVNFQKFAFKLFSLHPCSFSLKYTAPSWLPFDRMLPEPLALSNCDHMKWS